MQNYDVIVVGAGHAGCEAALAAARMGAKTAIFTITLDNIGVMSCNPSLGGPAKSHLVREIDALGGEMGRNIDKTFIQIRVLNTKKGPAVRALRAQADKVRYSKEMKKTIENCENLCSIQGMVTDIVVEDGKVIVGVVGVLQFEVLEYRLKNEYNVEIKMDRLPFRYVRWIESYDGDVDRLNLTSDAKRVKDFKDRDLIIFQNDWGINWALDHNSGLVLSGVGKSDE